MPKLHLTKCELEVMDVVWRKGRATVQDVVDSLERPLAYTTVMTTLKILDEQRDVLRKKKQGRAYVYEPAVSREEISSSMAADLTQRLFGGSVKSFVLSLVESDSMSQSDIEELKQAIESLEKEA
ncbi:BlaI/MecI/CopY family transcriptional regulator [Gimesia maris]|jgi:predicted transcriptional regulator|uniref:BlaI/MecI/CopY family transcriptional regulator n=1 Tax=Gimesia maris TaxID=122 RepID=A0A3D3R5H9_9PLAN|nr:BlaI/MecI/CopY family transcriptional regulator [Gimesia maris]EDL61915.1 probable beta-lactamase repressor [Gimesia maris DSM 8797]QDT80767.1 Penicillinase repressor [Gimesia maris]QDU16483.1 Penicillinase repressor [Gimesia maris]QEG18529.1 Penicillinase repressor [Gimesia maris]QGQ28505.1 BlaI/MecI/CopY family transcriptional regulator [Gimesia maris]|tara:strand:- start:46963 stop:47337 length:375 start_codon:yes stop_codon:yes gene_type:complete